MARWHRGIRFEPTELLEKLAAMIPKPRITGYSRRMPGIARAASPPVPGEVAWRALCRIGR